MAGELRLGIDEGSNTIGRLSIDRGVVCVSDDERTRTTAVLHGGAAIAVLGRHPSWSKALSAYDAASLPAPAIFPQSAEAAAGARRRMVAFVHAALCGDAGWRLAELARAVQAIQAPLTACIDSSPGRSASRRRQLFLRFQRVRQRMALNPRHDLDVPALARMVNYSTWQFIKVFHQIYGETPYAYLLRCRVEHAQRLILRTDLGIGEVARESGFESRATFNRVFKEHTGMPPSALRAASAEQGPVLRLRTG
ncbi:MAG TPA: AraC family transcriptional regulator [Mizugakiibacter sp.]